MVYRRDVLKAGLLILAAPAFSIPAFAKKQRRFIDVHCHFFNARDIPIRGFLQRVVLADYAANQNAAKQAGLSISFDIWKGMMAYLADFVLKHEAPNPEDEMKCLRQGPACLRAASALKSARGLSEPRDPLADVLQQRLQPSESKSRSPSEGSAHNQEAEAFVDFVLNEMKASGVASPASSAKSMRGLGSSVRRSAEAVADFLKQGGSYFSRYFEWAKLLTDYRETIARKYLSVYDGEGRRLVLAAPALVDYNYWLNDQTPSPLEEQVKLMGQLSLKLPVPTHGYVAFDPLRAVRGAEGPAPLDIVKEAVTKHGFLGVKLYSPMGFRPSGNADHALTFPDYAWRHEPGFGEKLDAALYSLYDWCHAEDVPILAHTTESQSAGPDFAARAEPQFWDAVLSKYPKLRVDLAHFGNFSQAFTPNGDPVANYSKTWEYEIAAFIKRGRYPNLYADISYFWWVLEGSSEKDHLKAAKKLFEKYFDTDPNAERLLFGTDWNMSGKAPGAANYVGNVETFFRDVGLKEPQLDNLFFKNALRFLGLDRQTKSKARLKRFYEKAGKPFPDFA